jgi:DNA-binding Lrp family transcriptional regulator
MKLDRIDIAILRQLQMNGRMTNIQLAEQVGLSPSPCLTRVKRLESSGVIAGYEAQFDLARFGDFVTAYAEITLKNHRREEASRFERAVCRIEEVVEFHMVNGKYDYLVKIVATGYEGPAAIMEDLWNSDLGVKSFTVFIVTSVPIRKNTLPI